MQPKLTTSFDFLSQLANNNTREWFAINKKFYEQAHSEFLDFTNALIASIRSFDPSIGTIEAKDCVFRIYRDVRFAHDKSPYKTNMGAYMTRGGRKAPFAGYYFHLQPSASFLSGGIYMGEPSTMKRIREEIDMEAEAFIKIVESPAFIKTFPSLGEESLKRVPKGFSPQSPAAKYLMLKHITPHCALPDSVITSGNLLEHACSVYKEMMPAIQFLNRAISDR